LITRKKKLERKKRTITTLILDYQKSGQVSAHQMSILNNSISMNPEKYTSITKMEREKNKRKINKFGTRDEQCNLGSEIDDHHSNFNKETSVFKVAHDLKFKDQNMFKNDDKTPRFSDRDNEVVDLKKNFSNKFTFSVGGDDQNQKNSIEEKKLSKNSIGNFSDRVISSGRGDLVEKFGDYLKKNLEEVDKGLEGIRKESKRLTKKRISYLFQEKKKKSLRPRNIKKRSIGGFYGINHQTNILGEDKKYKKRKILEVQKTPKMPSIGGGGGEGSKKSQVFDKAKNMKKSKTPNFNPSLEKHSDLSMIEADLKRRGDLSQNDDILLSTERPLNKDDENEPEKSYKNKFLAGKNYF